MKKEFKPLPIKADAEIAEIIKDRAIPNMGRAIKAANEQAEAPDRPHQLKGKLTKASYDALQRRLCEEKIRGDGVTIDCLIARGLKAIGVAIDEADLLPDRRRR